MEIQVEESDNLTESGTDGEVIHVLSLTKGQQGQSQSQGQVKRTEVKKIEKKTQRKSQFRVDKNGETRRKNKPVHNYKIYLHKVLKQVHPECAISKRSMEIIDNMMTHMFDIIATESSKLVSKGKTKTLSSRDVQTAVKLILPGELSKHAVSEGTKAVTKYISSREPLLNQDKSRPKMKK